MARASIFQCDRLCHALSERGPRRLIAPLLGLALFGGALFVLRTELDAFTYHALAADIIALPALQVVAALALTLANYAVLTGYDFLAFAYVGKESPLRDWLPPLSLRTPCPTALDSPCCPARQSAYASARGGE